MFLLTRRESSSIPLEVDGLTPSALASLSPIEVARLPVQHGNRQEPLGEFFDVIPHPGDELRFSGPLGHVHGIGLGLAEGLIRVEGDCGRHAGARMTGGRLVIHGNAADWLGAEMRGGTIDVLGHAGHFAGAAYRGARRGMTGGLIHIRGHAGDELAWLMRRGIIRVDGPVGSFAGASLIAGTLILLGGAGPRLGAGMKRGTILLRGTEPPVPSSFRLACRIQPTFLTLFRSCFADWPIRIGQLEMNCYRGDLLTGGRGEVFVHPLDSIF